MSIEHKHAIYKLDQLLVSKEVLNVTKVKIEKAKTQVAHVISAMDWKKAISSF